MEGHKRVAGSPVCPTPDKRVLASASPGRSLISPPPSPSRQTSSGSVLPLTERSFSHETTGVEACTQLKFEHLPGGGYRRRNPNWESGVDYKQIPKQQFQPHPHTPHRGYRAPSPAASIVSTVPADYEPDYRQDLDIDQISDVSSDDDAFGSNSSDSSASTLDAEPMYPDTPLGRQSSFVARIADYARFNKSMVTVFRAKGSEVSRIEKETRRRGVHTATMPRASSSGASSSRGAAPLARDNSMLVVLGKSPDFVEEVAARAHEMYAQQQAQKNADTLMPGTLTRNPSIEGPRMVTFVQMFVIAVLSSLMVVYGMSILPS